MARVGMKHLVFAPISQENDGAAPTYGAGAVLGRAVRGARTPTRYDAKLHGDDGIAESYNGLKEVGVEIETTELEEANAVKLGIYKAITSGTGTSAVTTYRQTQKPTAYGGLGWVETHVRKGETLYVSVWIYKVQLAPGTIESKTLGDNLEYGTSSLSGVSLPPFADADGDDAYCDLQVFKSLDDAMDWVDDFCGT